VLTPFDNPQGDSAHLQLIHISRSLMTRSPFEHDPKMLAWEIAAVKAGSFRRCGLQSLSCCKAQSDTMHAVAGALTLRCLDQNADAGK
jgi:hypothetical protein